MGTALSRSRVPLGKQPPSPHWRNAARVAPWLGRLLLIGWLGRYRSGLTAAEPRLGGRS